MLTKKFKSNKFYEVTCYFFKYGHDYDEIDGNTTVWDSLEKAKAFIEKYRFNRKFYSATVEEIIVDRVISAEDYKEHNYKRISSQKFIPKIMTVILKKFQKKFITTLKLMKWQKKNLNQ